MTGLHLAQYRNDAELGRGGMGEVTGVKPTGRFCPLWTAVFGANEAAGR